VSWFALDARAARITWTILVILGGVGLIYAMRQVVILVALSLFLAYLLFPLVRLTERWLIPTRSLAIAAVYVVILTALGGAGAVIGPRLTTEAQSLAAALPEMSEQIQSGEIIGNVLRPHGWERREIAEVERLMRTHMGQIIGYAQHAGAGLLKWLAGAWVIVLIPVFAFFILKDVEQLTSTAIVRLSHRSGWGMWRDIAQDVHRVLGNYVRVQVLLSLITFATWSAVFLMAGVPYALVLAGIGGALEFIPVVGPVTAGVAAIGVSLFGGYAHPWLVVAFVLVWRAIQDWGTAPLIMRRGIDIHPAVVIAGVLAGGELGGVVGMFLSVPVIAAARIVWRRLQAPASAPVADPYLPERAATERAATERAATELAVTDNPVSERAPRRALIAQDERPRSSSHAPRPPQPRGEATHRERGDPCPS
jgi:predicted PurR-regulated permease PerM